MHDDHVGDPTAHQQQERGAPVTPGDDNKQNISEWRMKLLSH